MHFLNNENNSNNKKTNSVTKRENIGEEICEGVKIARAAL
jgi:hypothetical protein